MIAQNLGGSWTLTLEDGRAFETPVPGTLLQTLLEHRVIPDPFDGMNEYEACEQTRRTFTMERSFSVSEEELGCPCADLVFEGVDTEAVLFVNDRQAAVFNNMHRTWRVPVRGLLRPGENTLRVVFSPALDAVARDAAENPDITYDGGSELVWTGGIRKAHYMFGWDWGPRLPDAGLWRPVRLECYACRIAELRVHQEHAESGAVTLRVTAETAAEQVRLTLLSPEGDRVGSAALVPGETAVLPVPEPRLWWPNGLGDQPLYTLCAEALSAGAVQDRRFLRLGLRTLTVSTRPDAWGQEFAFCCNGVKFFAMGADYIPEDNLLARCTRGRTDRLLQDCRDAHFNCVRVWGGGIYPDDDFFDLCDEKGLVVWLDLMFACNVYRLSDAFRANISQEARDNLRRVRHHASLGLICGNNEMETAWLSWGGVISQPESLKRDYLEQFEVLLKDIAAQEAPDTFYWPSSPSSGGGFDDPNSLDRGDVHDWSVWHGRRPFSDFTERYPRFCSEFGFESFPAMETLRSFIHNDRDMNPFSRVMESHQKCHSGNATMLHYLAQSLPYPYSMEQLVHATQYLQAEAVRAGVEHWRRNRGRCMGAIYWQINDCWPVASWAGIDSFGRWKALHYEAKRFFAPLLISLSREAGGYAVFVSNERREAFSGTAECAVCDAEGNVLRRETFPVACPALSSVCAGRIIPGAGEALPLVRCRLLGGDGSVIGENEVFADPPKYLPLSRPCLRTEVNGNRISLTADTLCLAVALEAEDALFSDNWFTLYPGETRTVTADRPVRADSLTVRWLSDGRT